MCEPATIAAIGTYFTGGAAAATATAATAAGAGLGVGAAVGATAATTAAAGMTTAQMISLGLSAASAGVGAYGTYTQAQTAKAVAKANARTADMHAKDALSRGEKAAQAARQRGAQIEGSQRAALSARGLDLSEGTPADILGQTDFFTQSDMATARTNARREAFAAKSQQAGFQAQADSINPGLQMAGSLLGSGGRVADKWYAYSGRG